jgi:putative heme transporter
MRGRTAKFRPPRGDAGTSSQHGPTGRAAVIRLGTLGLLGLLALALLASALGSRRVLHQIRHVSLAWIALAVALELAAKLSCVVIFRAFFDRLPGQLARPLAWTAMASSALLPGGSVSGLALGGWLIHVAGAPTRWAFRRASGLWILTGAVSAAAVVASGLALIAGAPGPHGFVRVVLPIVLVLGVCTPIAALPAVIRKCSSVPRWLRFIGAGVQEAEGIVFGPPNWRLIGALGNFGFDVAVLWVTLKAFGPPPSVPALILAYGIRAPSNVLPIPAGIGVLEASLTGSLVLYGVSPEHAAVAAIVYHAIAVWVPGLGGLVAYWRVRSRLVERNRDSSSINAFAPEGATP